MTGAADAPSTGMDRLVRRLRAAGCVFAEEEAALLIEAAGTPAELDSAELAGLVSRRIGGEPLEHVLGWVDFGGLRIAVDPDVFVPRQRTTALADRAEAAARRAAARGGARPVVVDLCCGCGAVGAVVAHRLRLDGLAIDLHAADVDPAAAACAARNLTPYGGRTYAGDLYDALSAALRGTVDVLVANVPYVPTEAVALMPPEARDHEPRIALDGGVDGLTIARRLIDGAPSWLARGGIVMVECDEGQAGAAADAVRAAGLAAGVDTDDDREVTVVTGIPIQSIG